MSRSVKEWVGKHDDEDVPPRVRLRIWRRQCGENNFVICPLSKAILRSTAECHLDHAIALIDQGEHRESNLRFIHIDAHKVKTSEEVARKARVDCVAKSHLRIAKNVGPNRPIRSAPLPTTRRAAARAARGRKTSLPPYLPPGYVSALDR